MGGVKNMGHDAKRWYLDIEISSERRAGFFKPTFWTNMLRKVFLDSSLNEKEQVEVALFVVSELCRSEPMEFSGGYLLRVQELASAKAQDCYRRKEMAVCRAYVALANAAAIQFFNRLDTSQSVRKPSESPMSTFLTGLRRRLGATWAPLPVKEF